jgi:hypothetical protein
MFKIALFFIFIGFLPAQASWLHQLEGEYEGKFKDCLIRNGFTTKKVSTDFKWDFTIDKEFGDLVGGFEFLNLDQEYHVKMSYYPDDNDPYRLQIKSGKFERRMKAKESSESLHFTTRTQDFNHVKVAFVPNDEGYDFYFKKSHIIKRTLFYCSGKVKKAPALPDLFRSSL